jgi:glycosyltransferase involved in cell wall biosynthesis
VSVVVPAYNAERFLDDALASVCQQTYPAIECIVVDDGSTDDTAGVVARHPSITYIRKDNGGVSSARNLGASRANGDFVTFLDYDDVWWPEKVEAQMELMLDDSSLALVYCGVEMVDERLRPIEVYPCAPPEVALRNSLLLEQPYMFGTTMLLRRNVLGDVGGFDERLSTSAETDLACRIAMRFPVGAVDRPLVRYRQHGLQMHRGLDAFQSDMELVYAKVFEEGRRPSVGGVSARKARASMYWRLTVGRLAARQWRLAAFDGARALRSDPWRTLELARRQLRRR